MKKILIAFIFLLPLILPQKAEAFAPPVWGYVKTKTGAPVAGIAVRWFDASGNTWFTYTNTSGYFYYPTYNKLSREKRFEIYNRLIDTDLDGIPDSRENSIEPEEEDEEGINGGFGCSTNPHVIIAVMPKNWPGAFSVPPPFEAEPGNELNNSMAEVKVVDIIYDPDYHPPVTIAPTEIPPDLTITPGSGCDCVSMTVSDNLRVGELITIIIKARSLVPETTEVSSMLYRVYKDGVQIDNSNTIKADEITDAYGLYKTDWVYRIPAGPESPGNYHISAQIFCSKKTVALVPQASSQEYGLYPDVTVYAPSGVDSLQLGSFYPVTDLKFGCKDMYFSIR